MFKAFSTTTFLLMGTVLMAQSPFAAKGWQKNWANFAEGKWIMKTEVSNADYQLFLRALLASGKDEEYEFFYPDTLGWKLQNAGAAPFSSFYFSNKIFSNYPVVSITYNAAYGYCMWLTESYNRLKNKPFGEVTFRLPTREEWMLAARGGRQDGRIYPWVGNQLRNEKQQWLANFKKEGNPAMPGMAGSLNEKAYITTPVNAFWPNELGIYNMSGNVAEIVEEWGVAVGGSYLEGADGIRIDSKKQFEKPMSDVGFRVVMVRK